MKEYEKQDKVPSLGGGYSNLSLWRQLRLLGPSTLEAVGQLSPSNLEARGSPCGLVLCDNGHELSSLLNQAT